MLIHDYDVNELAFAYCYRVYFRYRTRRGVPVAQLGRLDRAALQSLLQSYEIHPLECASNDAEIRTLLSLNVMDSVSKCASVVKGRISRWLTELVGQRGLVGRGYFACTAGQSTEEAVAAYLDRQGEHHGYARRARPPLFVREYPMTSDDNARLATDHSVHVLQLHLVLSTWRRKGVFGQSAAEAVATLWRAQQQELRIAVTKVSFVPDHIHLAVRIHPAVSPGAMVASLMNSAQRFMYDRFEDDVVRAGVERLWQSGAYVGAFGNLASPQIRAYIGRWNKGVGARDD